MNSSLDRLGLDSLSDPQLGRLMDELAARMLAAESVDIEAVVKEHPEYADQLRRLLPVIQALVGLNSEPAGDGDSTAKDRSLSAEGTTRLLGDFRILREVGKGGMGIVYEAEQISLKRRVALKVLPLAATMDPRHLQRFHNEAQAAACLHHTNIVPVFSVGCERSVHFYAMQFIDGQPLSEIIRQMCRLEKKAPSAGEEHTVAYQPPAGGDAASTPPVAAVTPLTSEGRRSRDYFRKVAELGVQAAEALDHAHQLGIVHRDIKPANLLLDGRGNVWVTDFGLAHVQHGEASLTGTGQMVGTPRYMSPEQAMAKRVPIDHRTDVYSLGATLYELLTLRPAFASDDRQELLRQIAFEEPPRPRRLERGIPAELEIIVLKAMEKRPQDRFATAQELADDLRRWLLDQPIRARRPSRVQVARKWMRRHQAVVWSASLLLLILMIVGVANALWWMQQQTAAKTEAQTALQEAQRWQQDERWSEALSAVRRAQGILRSFRSESSLRQQADQLGKDLEMARRLEEARLQLTVDKEGSYDSEACITDYAAAFVWYGLDVKQLNAVVAGEYIRSRSIPMQLVAALDNWACLQRGREGHDWKHLLAVARAADADAWRNRLRNAWERQDGKAMDNLLASAEVKKQLPTTLSLLGFSSSKRMNVSDERLALLRRVQQRYPADFWINHDLARVIQMAQPPQLEEVIGYYRAAVALRPQSVGVHVNLGEALRDKGRLDEAIAEYREALRINNDIAKVHHFLGMALREKGRLDESIYEFREVIRLDKDYAQAHSNLGIALADKGGVDEAIKEYREAIRLKKDLPEAHYNLGNALKANGLLDQAIGEYREATRLKQSYAEAHCNLGQALLRQGKFQQAVEELRRGHELGSRKPKWPYPSAVWVRTAEGFADLETRWPTLLKRQEQPKDARERLVLAHLCQLYKQFFAAATRWYSEAFAEEPKLAEDLNNQHRYRAACAAALAGCGQGNDADKLDAKERAHLRQQALDWLRADLKVYRQVMDRAADKAGPEIAQRMQHWLQDGDFAAVRGEKALAKLPKEERKDWHKLWQEVEALRQRAAQQPKTPGSARP